MIILEDVAEQRPLDFKQFGSDYIEAIERTNLNVGDYSCYYNNGTICPTVFERKTIPDLFGTMTRGNRRYKKEVLRAREQGIQLVMVVDGSLSRVLKGYSYSKATGLQILRTTNTFFIKYGVPTLFFNNKEDMAKYIYEFFISYGNTLK